MPESDDQDTDRYTVPGLERGLRILCEFSRQEPVLTAPELARRLGVPRSTVFRLLVTLEQMGFVERTDNGREHRLGLAVLRLGFEYLASLGITELGRPILERLRDEFGFAANLVMRDGRDIVYVAKAASTSPFVSSVTVGTRLPAHATALGRVLLSDLTLSELRRLYPEPALERRSAHTPPNADALFQMVEKDRARGHVMAEAFFEPHISTIAAPVHGENGHVLAALGVTVPAAKLPAQQKAALVERVCEAARELSRLMNFHPQTQPAASNVVSLHGK